ncbi:MAG: hypothetical protein GEV10_19870 [Streptosporangiales bacterium]|nr:hypothetical protein [Streptosporangiales bacterium]
MRHFAGVLLGIILVPVFFTLNWLVNYAGDRVADDQGRMWLLLLLGAYAVMGLLVAIFLASRSISAISLIIGGLLIAAAEVLLLLPALADIEVNLPRLYDYPNITDGYLLVAVGVALLFGGLFPTRWARPKPVDEDEDLPVRGSSLLPGDERGRDADYDSSWGSGRNEYAEEPEAPYTQGGRYDEPQTRQFSASGGEQHHEGEPATQPGQYDQSQPSYDYDQGQEQTYRSSDYGDYQQQPGQYDRPPADRS